MADVQPTTATTTEPTYKTLDPTVNSEKMSQPTITTGVVDSNPLPPGQSVEHIENRRDSDVGPLGESKDHSVPPVVRAAGANETTSSTSSDAKHIEYGDTSGLGTGTGTNAESASNANRRQSLADSPYHGNVDTTVNPTDSSKKWKFNMGDFGLRRPSQQSNAVSQSLNKDGSVSDQGGQGRVARGIGSISASVKRGGVDDHVTEKDPVRKWSLTHGDFGLKMPRQASNASAQELNHDGSFSGQGGLGPGGEATNGDHEGGGGFANGQAPRKYSGVDSVPLGRQGARGIGSISGAVKRGSVDQNVSHHDVNRKWSLKDADFGLKMPKGKSNLAE